MRAIVCNGYGHPENLQIEEQPEPVLAANQVRVAVKAAGVNYVDGLLVEGTYQIKVPVPFVPGSDIAGEVLEVGADVAGFACGDRVFASPGIGGYADQLLAAPEQLSRIPDSMSDAVAATFLQANCTAYYGLATCGGLKAGETVLVLGAAGGTGMAAIHIAKALGARVVAAASSDEKLAACKAAGADEFINYQHDDLKVQAKALSGGQGVDLVFDPVGGDLAEQALRACAPGARYLVIGFVAGIPQLPFNLPLLKRCSVVGVNWGAASMAEADLDQMVKSAILALFEGGALRTPPIKEYSLEQTGQAIADLHARKIAGRAVVMVC
ncbi:MAG: NADPH:quinone oxidoreductase family protein [Halioglobus sp.]